MLMLNDSATSSMSRPIYDHLRLNERQSRRPSPKSDQQTASERDHPGTMYVLWKCFCSFFNHFYSLLSYWWLQITSSVIIWLLCKSENFGCWFYAVWYSFCVRALMPGLRFNWTLFSLWMCSTVTCLLLMFHYACIHSYNTYIFVNRWWLHLC